jgi:Domain of unknown function DUF29
MMGTGGFSCKPADAMFVVTMAVETAMSDIKTLYDEDFVAWSKHQASALRAAARSGTNQPLDWENLAEEIEDLGRSHRNALRAHIMRIVQHLVKLEQSPAIDPRNGWRRSIRLGRLRMERLLKDNPSLTREVKRLLREATKEGIELAIIDLEEHGEIDDVDFALLRRSSYTADQILADWFPPAPSEPPRGTE